LAQTSPSAPYSQTPTAHVFLLMTVTKFHTHKKTNCVYIRADVCITDHVIYA
jgi:hypothetical protein